MLREQFPVVEVHQCALSDQEGSVDFHYIPELPGWSGLQPQPYPKQVSLQKISVRSRRLDDIIPSDMPIAFIKIDVEGAELNVLRGATGLLRRCRPIVYFDCGKIHHAHYETTPQQVFDLFASCRMGVFLLDRTPLSAEEFTVFYETTTRRNYGRTAFLAMPWPQ